MKKPLLPDNEGLRLQALPDKRHALHDLIGLASGKGTTFFVELPVVPQTEQASVL